jgi:hypothetical protein
MESKGNIIRSIPVDVSSVDYADDKGFFIRSNGAGNIRYATMGSAKATTVSRKIATNVATLKTTEPHGLTIGETVVITGVGHADYNGVFVVVSVPTTKSFTFALTHADEAETSDTGGIVEAAILKAVFAQEYFCDPEFCKKIFSTGTTATGIHVGYGIV